MNLSEVIKQFFIMRKVRTFHNSAEVTKKQYALKVNWYGLRNVTVIRHRGYYHNQAHVFLLNGISAIV